MSEPESLVECERHGESHVTFVCQHLARGERLGFFFDDTSEDPRPDAWCSDCDSLMMADGGWNEVNEEVAGITLLCAMCYDDVKARNAQTLPA